MGRPAGYWVWDASLLDALRAIGDGRWGIGDWTAFRLLGMGRFAIGRPAGYWVWDAPLLDAP